MPLPQRRHFEKLSLLSVRSLRKAGAGSGEGTAESTLSGFGSFSEKNIVCDLFKGHVCLSGIRAINVNYKVTEPALLSVFRVICALVDAILYKRPVLCAII